MAALRLFPDVCDLSVDFLVVNSHGISSAKVQDDLASALLLTLPSHVLESGHCYLYDVVGDSVIDYS